MHESVEAKVANFFSQFPQRHYPKGQMLIHAGDNPEYIYYLEKGTVRQYDISYRGDEIVVNVFKPPAFFPMINAITDTDNTFFFTANSEATARVAPLGETAAFVRQNNDVLYDLLRRVYAGTAGILGRMVQLMAGTARTRLMYELIITCHRFGTKQGASYILTESESDIAARAGLSRETVSREMHKLREDGMVIVTHNTITVTALDKLEQTLAKEI